MKRILIGLSSLVLAVLLFAGGILANEWLSFTGDDEIEEAGEGVDRIMEILKEVNEGKITAEEAAAILETEKASLEDEKALLETEKTALEDEKTALQDRIDELEEMNPSGLAKQNKELREQVSGLQTDLANVTQERNNANEYIAHLEAELTKANNAVNSHAEKVSEALDEAESLVGESE